MTELAAFVDESLRPGRYLLGAVVLERRSLPAARRVVKELVLPGQRRLHFHEEGARRRRKILTDLRAIEMAATIYVCRRGVGLDTEAARAMCLRTVVTDLQGTGRPIHLVIESRDAADYLDRSTVTSARLRVPRLTFEHLRPAEEALLCLPDCLTWAAGAGSPWTARLASLAFTRKVG